MTRVGPSDPNAAKMDQSSRHDWNYLILYEVRVDTQLDRIRQVPEMARKERPTTCQTRAQQGPTRGQKTRNKKNREGKRKKIRWAKAEQSMGPSLWDVHIPALPDHSHLLHKIQYLDEYRPHA